MKKRRLFFIFIVLLMISAGTAFGVHWFTSSDISSSEKTGKHPKLDENAVPWQGEKDTGAASKQRGITLPGFKTLRLRADTQTQSVSLFNPASNDCYFVISLYLPDGTLLWKSKMIPPGKGLYQIKLKQKVAAGDYKESTLKYECYKMNKDLTKLNGGTLTIELEVE